MCGFVQRVEREPTPRVFNRMFVCAARCFVRDKLFEHECELFAQRFGFKKLPLVKRGAVAQSKAREKIALIEFCRARPLRGVVCLREVSKFQHINLQRAAGHERDGFAVNVERIIAQRAFQGRKRTAQCRARVRRVRIGIKKRGEFIALMRGLREREIRGERERFARVERNGFVIAFQARRAEQKQLQHEYFIMRGLRKLRNRVFS